MLKAVWSPKVRQLKISEVLDEGFKVFKHGLGRFVLFQLIIYIPSTIVLAILLNTFGDILIQMLEKGAPPDPYQMIGKGALLLLGLIALQILLGSLTLIAMSRGVAQTYLGRPWSAGTIFKEAMRLMPRGIVIDAVLLFMFLICVLVPAALVGGVVLVSLSALGSGIAVVVIAALFGGAAALFAIWAGVFLVLRYGLTLTALSIEEVGIGKAFARSVELMRGQYIRGGALLMLLIAISALFSGPLGLLVPTPDFATLDIHQIKAIVPQFIRAQILSTIFGQVVGMFIQAYSSICWTLFYFSARCEKEGFDLTVMAERA